MPEGPGWGEGGGAGASLVLEGVIYGPGLGPGKAACPWYWNCPSSGPGGVPASACAVASSTFG